jgi:hypothetical protein
VNKKDLFKKVITDHILLDLLVYDQQNDKTIILTLPPKAFFQQYLDGYITDGEVVYLASSRECVGEMFSMNTDYPAETGQLEIIGIL